MALTCDFKETIKARVQRDPAFREELIKEAIQCVHAGDVDTGKAVMRDYINATKPWHLPIKTRNSVTSFAANLKPTYEF